jgi:hypothetical protein
MFGNHRAKMKNRQGTEGAPCYFSTLYTVITPIEGVTPWLQAPYPFYGPEGSFGSESPWIDLAKKWGQNRGYGGLTRVVGPNNLVNLVNIVLGLT